MKTFTIILVIVVLNSCVTHRLPLENSERFIEKYHGNDLNLDSNHTYGYKIKEKPQVLIDNTIIKINKDEDGSNIEKFMQAFHSGNVAILQRTFYSEEATPMIWNFVTENGKALLIVDYTKDQYGIDGYRVSELLYKEKNKFINLDAKTIINLDMLY